MQIPQCSGERHRWANGQHPIRLGKLVLTQCSVSPVRETTGPGGLLWRRTGTGKVNLLSLFSVLFALWGARTSQCFCVGMRAGTSYSVVFLASSYNYFYAQIAPSLARGRAFRLAPLALSHVPNVVQHFLVFWH